MMKFNATNAVRVLKTSFAKRSPEILLGVGIAGFISGTIMAVKATPKALELIEEAEAETVQDKVAVSWKCYIPSVVTIGVSTACVLGSHNVSMRRNAALATAYSLSEQALQEFNDAVKSEVSDKKYTKIVDEMQSKRFRESDAYVNASSIPLNGSDILCFDAMSKRAFVSNRDKLDLIFMRLNHDLDAYDSVEVAEWYYAIGLSVPELAHNHYWHKRNTSYKIEPTYTYECTDDGKPALVVGFYFDCKPVSFDEYR